MSDAFIKSVFAQVEVDKAINAAARGQLPIGELAAILSTYDAAYPVVGEIGGGRVGLDGVNSYRGYYSDLAIEIGGSTTVGELLAALRSAVGATFTGYKGGDFVMSRLTPVWIDHYGSASGNAVTGIREDAGTIVLETTKEEW